MHLTPKSVRIRVQCWGTQVHQPKAGVTHVRALVSNTQHLGKC